MAMELGAKAVPESGSRLALVQPCYTSFGLAGLSEYFAYMGRRIIESLTDSRHWVLAMLALEGCQRMPDVAEQLAEVAVTSLKISTLDTTRMIEVAIEYVKRLRVSGRTADRERRFYQYLVDAFANLVVREKGFDAFLDFHDRDWYKADESVRDRRGTL
jgi:hypothetical protein